MEILEIIMIGAVQFLVFQKSVYTRDLQHLLCCFLQVMVKPVKTIFRARRKGSALDHIKLTYHDVTVFAIRDFKTLEVLKKLFFMIILLYVNPNISHNQILILTIKKKLRKKTFI